MNVVVDASAVGAFLLPDERDALAQFVAAYVAREDVVVPPIWQTELAHLILKARRRDRLDDDAFATALREADLLRQTVAIADPGSVSSIVTLAASTGLSAYDASYAALARHLGLPLLTRDGALARAARDLGIETLQP